MALVRQAESGPGTDAAGARKFSVVAG
jgi:hypothetical protein